MPALARPRQRNRDETEAALIRAAVALFAQKGYEATSTSAIAAAAGCSEALIQRYFGNKEGLLLTVVRLNQDDGGYLGFLDLPLQKSIFEEARLAFRYVADFMAAHSEQMRIIVSRIVIDPVFLADFKRVAVHEVAAAGIEARLRRYSETGLIDRKIDIAAATELLMSLNFQLGFVHPQMHHSKGETLDRLIDSFALFYARAVSPPHLKEVASHQDQKTPSPSA